MGRKLHADSAQPNFQSARVTIQSPTQKPENRTSQSMTCCRALHIELLGDESGKQQ